MRLTRIIVHQRGRHQRVFADYKSVEAKRVRLALGNVVSLKELESLVLAAVENSDNRKRPRAVGGT